MVGAAPRAGRRVQHGHDRRPHRHGPRGAGNRLGRRGPFARGGADFGRAICTTDRAPKGGAFRLSLSGGEAIIGAAAKGAGMISPGMATMLAYVTIGAPVDAAALQAMTAAAAAASFNRISVDGRMTPPTPSS